MFSQSRTVETGRPAARRNHSQHEPHLGFAARPSAASKKQVAPEIPESRSLPLNWRRGDSLQLHPNKPKTYALPGGPDRTERPYFPHSYATVLEICAVDAALPNPRRRGSHHGGALCGHLREASSPSSPSSKKSSTATAATSPSWPRTSTPSSPPARSSTTSRSLKPGSRHSLAASSPPPSTSSAPSAS